MTTLLKEVGENPTPDTEKKILVNGEEVTSEKLQELNQNSKIKLKEVESSGDSVTYKKLDKLHG